MQIVELGQEFAINSIETQETIEKNRFFTVVLNAPYDTA